MKSNASVSLHRNRVISTQTATYSYDANGSTIQKVEGKDFWRYGWDHENKLTTASTRKSAVRYKYDALGRRVQRVVGNGKENTKFTYQGNDVLIDNDDGTLTKYLNGPGIDNKLRATNGSLTSYFVSDHLGSTNGLTNSSGSLTASNSYDSFGNPANSSFPSRYQFTGREFDSFTNLQYSRARWYSTSLGRFISEDPIGFAGGDVNLYGYVTNSPIGASDPLGLITPAELADALDEGLDAKATSCGCDVPIGFVSVPPFDTFTAFDIAKRITNMLRVGRGTGRAIYDPDDNIYGQAANVAMDLQSGSDLFSTLVAPFAFPRTASGTAAVKRPPNPYGSKGSPPHQAGIQAVADDIVARGLTPSFEHLVRTPGGNKCRRFVDVAALDDFGNVVEFHQVGRVTTRNPKIPVARERKAIEDLLNFQPTVPVTFHPF